jgi:hypothetical protein
VIGVLGPWQRTLFGLSANGLDVGWVVLVPALVLAGYGLYAFDRGNEDQRGRVGRLLIVAGLLVGVAVAGNAEHISGLVRPGWGAIVSGVGGAGLLIAGVTILRSTELAS